MNIVLNGVSAEEIFKEGWINDKQLLSIPKHLMTEDPEDPDSYLFNFTEITSTYDDSE